MWINSIWFASTQLHFRMNTTHWVNLRLVNLLLWIITTFADVESVHSRVLAHILRLICAKSLAVKNKNLQASTEGKTWALVDRTFSSDQSGEVLTFFNVLSRFTRVLFLIIIFNNQLSGVNVYFSSLCSWYISLRAYDRGACINPAVGLTHCCQHLTVTVGQTTP